MSTQPFPPLTDDALRAHLSRRAEAPPPPSLAGDVFEALDRVPVRVRVVALPSLRFGRPAIPRLATAALSVALIVAVGFGTLAVLPALRGPSSGSAAVTPLTTAELASLAGDASTPVNATLVAATTIENRKDVCPMDRYPTIGVIVGTVKQVCVMGSGVDQYLDTPSTTGVFAFRVIAPGVLGLLGKLEPNVGGSLTYKVVDDWPLQGKTFLVDGWLGASELAGQHWCPVTVAVDPLDPAGSECPFQDWLSDEPTAPAMAAAASGETTPTSGNDAGALRGKARPVEAAGMRTVDGPKIESSNKMEAVRGIYVVRSVVGSCPNAAPQDSRGCSTWRVLARVSDIGIGKSSPSPATSSTPPQAAAAYPVTRPLTTLELTRALVAGSAAPGATVVASASFDRSGTCDVPPVYVSLGRLAGASRDVCVVAMAGEGSPRPASNQGIFAFRVISPTRLGYFATVTSASGRLAFSADGFWPAGAAFLVDGWLVSQGPISCPSVAAATPRSIVDPGGTWSCGGLWLTSKKTSWQDLGGAPLQGANRVFRTAGDGLDVVPDGHGVYLVQTAAATCSTEATPSVASCSTGNLLARVDPIAVPLATATMATASSPAVVPTPSASAAGLAEPAALIGPGNRPLTVDQARAAVRGSPAAGLPRLAVVLGPIPLSGCLPAAPGDPTACPTMATGAGVWLSKVTHDGAFSPVGPIASPGGAIVSTLAQAYGARPSVGQTIVIVDAWLAGAAMDACDVITDPMPTCDEVSWLSADAAAQPAATDDASHVAVWPGDYHRYAGGPAGGGPAVRALYAVEWRPDGARILARLEAVGP